jgi:UDP-glucose 4-epimerase
MTLLVTGGTGFLGSYLTRYAFEQGGESHVVVLDRYAERGRIADVLDRVTVIEGDVADFITVSNAIAAHGVDRVAHFAFILGSPSPGQMIPYVKVQTLGTASVFEAARVHGVKRVLFASSVAAYGEQDAALLTEDLVCNPDNPYGSSKLWGESLARHYREELGLEVVCLRFGSTYGLGRAWRGSYASGLLSPPEGTHYMARVKDAVRGKAITMPRDDVVADWTYAGDAAQASWLALQAERLPNHLYNVGSEQRAVGEFTQAMRQSLPEADITVSDTETAGNPHRPMDTTLLRRDLGFTPAYTLRSGLEDYIRRIRIFDRYVEGT